VLSPSELEVLRQSLGAIPEEMGVVLVRSAYSPNIKERRDASCALFDPGGRMVAQAEHIPVHLGSMPLAVEELLGRGEDVAPGDAWIVNDPYAGGSHLPDITVISPVHAGEGGGDGGKGSEGKLLGFAVNKAHHADVGGSAPGSMPATARRLEEEGVVIPLQPLMRAGEPAGDAWKLLEEGSRTPEERMGDLRAQLAANSVGAARLGSFVGRYGQRRWAAFCDEVIDYSRRRMEAALARLREGTYGAEDVIEGPGSSRSKLWPPGISVPKVGSLDIAVEVTIGGGRARFDLSGSAGQVDAPMNAPYSVTLSAVYYSLRAMTDPTIPPNHGCYLPIEVVAPKGSLLNPERPHPVGAGNVETSQRIADVCLAALGQATPDGPTAMSQGTMNNVLIGKPSRGAFTFYETLGGGGGGMPWRAGMSGVHTHMTNTMNTPVEALEAAYPLRVRALRLHAGSGGRGLHPGGEGVVKEIEVLVDGAILTLLGDRRVKGPPGAGGGEDGSPGRDTLQRGGRTYELPSKCVLKLLKGDVIEVRTPGGGGWGKPSGGKPRGGDASEGGGTFP
jgi:N-methylhydantoinase B